MKKQSLFMLFMLIISTSALSAQYDLLKVYHLSKETHEALQIAEQNKHIALHSKKQVQAGFYPTISLAYTSQESETRKFKSEVKQRSLSVRQPIYNHQTFVANNKASLEVQVSKLQFQKQQQTLMLDTAKLYLNVIDSQIALRSLLSNLSLVNKNLTVINTKFQEGNATRYDIAEAKVTKQQLRSDIQVLRNTINSRVLLLQNRLPAQEEFTLLNNINQEKLHLLTLKETKNELLEHAIAHNTTILNNRLNKQIRTQNLKIAQAGFFPQVHLNATYTEYDQYLDSVLSLDVSMPIFNGFGTIENVRKNQSLVYIAELNAQQNQKQLKQQVYTNYANLLFYKDRVNTLLELVNLRKEESALQERRLQSNQATYKDVLFSENNYWSSITDYEQTIIKYILSYLTLKNTIGSLSINDITLVNSLLY